MPGRRILGHRGKSPVKYDEKKDPRERAILHADQIRLVALAPRERTLNLFNS